MSIKKNPRKKSTPRNVSVRMASDRGPGSVVVVQKPATPRPATDIKPDKQLAAK